MTAGPVDAMGAPPLRSFQYDSGSLSDIQNSVNLFRGAIAMPLDLLTLQGVNGLDVQVQATYDNKAAMSANRWNLDAPTGVLGLGWSMPYECIVAQGLARGDSANDVYYLTGSSGGAMNRLVRIDEGDPDAITFEVTAFSFWRITYSPKNQTWSITRENGTTYIYGDSNSGRNTVQWGVHWKNWSGSSTALGEQRYATAWNLSEIRSPWGDRIAFSYEQTTQAVGQNGLQYTKANYLSRITDAFDRTIDFVYGDKLYEPGQGICEYQDPHKAAPDNLPDAYQSRYETKYLDSIAVTASDGSPLMSIAFSYEIRHFVQLPPTDPAYPFLAKRCLVGIVQRNAAGAELPGFTFAYADTQATLPGAMSAVTYPAGALAQFTYQRRELLGTGRSIQIPAPAPGAVPRVWHGPDYIAVTWYSAANATTTLTVYTWNGRWAAWNAPPISAKIADQSLVIVPRPGFFALTLRNTTYNRDEFRLFRSDPNRIGQWLFELRTADVKSGAPATVLASGAEFLLAYNSAYTGPVFVGYAWDWRSQTWSSLPVPSIVPTSSSTVRLGAVANAYLVACYDTATKLVTFQTICRNAAARWETRPSWTSSATIVPIQNEPAFEITAADCFFTIVFISSVTQGDPGVIHYEARTWQWDERFYVFGADLPYVYTSAVNVWDGKVDLAPLALNFAASTLCNTQMLSRFNAGVPAWTQTSFGAGDAKGAAYAFAYGNDVAVMAQTAGGTTTCKVLQYDPNTSRWSSPSIAANGTSPTVSADTMTVGATVLVRQTGGTWKPLASGLQPGLDQGSVQNQAPLYIAYNDASGNARVALLRNGGIASDEIVAQNMKTAVAAGGPGTQLAGPSSFVVYPGSSFDSAPSLTLYQVAGPSMSQPIYDYPIVSLSYNDGFNSDSPYLQAFDYDQSTCTFDAATSLAQYGRARLVRGSKNATEVPYGYTDHYYSNGYSTQAGVFVGAGWPMNYNGILNGTLLAQLMYDIDGTEVARAVNCFEVRTRVQTSSTGWRNLAGAYFVPALRRQIKDGVLSEVQIGTSYATGQQTQTITSSYNSDGRPVRHRDVTIQASTVYPEMAAQNMLAQIAATQRYSTTDTEPEQLQAYSTTTWRAWTEYGPACWAPSATYEWRGTGNSTFGTAWWNGSPPDENWLCSSATPGRTARSQPSRAFDSAGTLSSSVFARDGATVVADFNNASPETTGATFWSCEPYEDPAQAWTCVPASAGAISSGDSHSGTSCFQFTQSGSLSRKLPVSEARSRYVLCAWVKSSQDFAGTLAWNLGASGRGGSKTSTRPIDPTHGVWTFSTWTLDLPQSDASTIDLEFAASITSGWARLDALAFFPVDSKFSARSMNMALRVPTAQLGPNGETTTTWLDDFSRIVGSSGPGPELSSLSAQYLVQQKSAVRAGAAFPAASPNRQIAVQAQQGGFTCTFPDGSEGDWQFAPDAGWTIANRSLSFVAAAGGPLGATATYGAFQSSALAIHTRVVNVTGQVAIGTGDYAVAWDATNGWRLLKIDGASASVLAQSAELETLAADWLFIIVDGRIMFFADGMPLFDLYVPQAKQNAGRVVLGLTAKGTFSQLLVAAGPTLATTFQDGAMKARQVLRLLDAQTGARGASLYDALERPAITTLQAYSTGFAAIAYDQELVTNGSPGNTIWTGAPLTGTLTQATPAAGGYPFDRTEYEASPLGRPVTYGLPGAEFAIRPDNAHVQRVAYTSNQSVNVSQLPAGKYFAQVQTNADGVSTVTLSDQLDTPLVIRSSNAQANSAVEVRFAYTPLGLMTHAIPPAAPAGIGAVVIEHDYLGREISRTTPDNGTTLSMHDNAGQVRFMRTSRGADPADPFIIYNKFDALGRLLETGSYSFLWNDQTEEELRSHVEDQSWPPAPATWKQRNHYDSDGQGTPNLVGRVWRVETNNGDTADADVVETFTYSVGGDVLTKSLLCTSFDAQPRTVTYRYTNTGSVAQISLGGPEPDTVYAYDRLDRATAVGTPQSADYYASYQYDANDAIVEEKLNPGGPQPVDRSISQTPTGWPQSLNDRTFREALTYTSGGVDGAGYWNGNVASMNTAAAVPNGDYAFRFLNDSYDRLTVAQNTTATESLTYDDNGNIQTWANQTTRTFVYENGTNRLKNTDGDLAAQTYEYDADGNTVASPLKRMTIAYDAVTNATTSVKTADGSSLQFTYGEKSTRVLKRDGSGKNQRLYVRGTNARPLLEEKHGEGAGGRATYIYGPSGLIGMRQDDAVWSIIKDHLGSTRTIVDRTGALVAAFAYDPFGNVHVLLGGGPDMPYLYTGQEFDAETGLYNFNLRFYDPNIGRFYSIDPAGQQPSPYVYVANAPLRYVDRSGADFGLSLLIAVIIGIVIGAAVSAAAYAIINRDHFNWRDFGIAIGVGALAGGISAGVGFAGPALLASAATSLGAASVAQSATFSVLSGVAFGAAGNVLGQLAANAATGTNLNSGLGFAAVTGAIAGGFGGYVGWRMNVGKEVSLHGTSSNFTERIAQRINPPAPGANFGGAQLGEGFYTSTQRATANYFAGTSVANNGGNQTLLRVFSRSYNPLSDTQVPAAQEWAALPWATNPAQQAFITNFDTLSGGVSGLPGMTQIKFNPRTYSNLWAFPEQPTGMWRYLSWA